MIVSGGNVVLCEKNIICARYQNVMKMNDACGDAQRDDKVYLRDVHLPSMHINLPIINFRYTFAGAVINIKTDNVFPTLTRNALTDEKSKELSYAIGYAISSYKFEKCIDAMENWSIIKEMYNKKNLFIGKE